MDQNEKQNDIFNKITDSLVHKIVHTSFSPQALGVEAFHMLKSNATKIDLSSKQSRRTFSDHFKHQLIPIHFDVDKDKDNAKKQACKTAMDTALSGFATFLRISNTLSAQEFAIIARSEKEHLELLATKEHSKTMALKRRMERIDMRRIIDQEEDLQLQFEEEEAKRKKEAQAEAEAATQKIEEEQKENDQKFALTCARTLLENVYSAHQDLSQALKLKPNPIMDAKRESLKEGLEGLALALKQGVEKVTEGGLKEISQKYLSVHQSLKDIYDATRKDIAEQYANNPAVGTVNQGLENANQILEKWRDKFYDNLDQLFATANVEPRPPHEINNTRAQWQSKMNVSSTSNTLNTEQDPSQKVDPSNAVHFPDQAANAANAHNQNATVGNLDTEKASKIRRPGIPNTRVPRPTDPPNPYQK